MPLSVVYINVDGHPMSESRGGVVTEYVHDPLGNLIATHNSVGIVTHTAEYWPYGEMRTQTGTNPSPWAFCGTWGYRQDPGGQMYVRARYYRPTLGRWQTVDPLWPAELAYVYAQFSPLIHVDPSGRKVYKCWRNVIPFGFQNITHWYFKTDIQGCPCIGYGKTGVSFDCDENRDNSDENCELVPGISDAQEKCLCQLAKNAAIGWKLCTAVWSAANYDSRDLNCQHFLSALMKKCTGDVLPGADWGDPFFDYEDCIPKYSYCLRSSYEPR